LTSMAKIKTSEVAKRIALEGMQMMGGYGYATEYDMESHVRHSLVLSIYVGSNEIQREIISGSLGLPVAQEPFMTWIEVIDTVARITWDGPVGIVTINRPNARPIQPANALASSSPVPSPP